jgi:O-antigen/teichoic acid export membrane protein
MSSTKRIVKNTLWLFSSEVITITLGLIITIFIARYLGDSSFGKYSYAFAFANLFLIFSDFGITYFLIREVARDKKKTEKYFGNCLSLKFIFLSLMFLLTFIAINLIEKSKEIIILVSLATIAVFILNLGYFYKVLPQAYEIMQYEAIIRVIEKIILFVLIIGILTLGLGLTSIIIVYLFAFCVSFLLFFLVVSLKIGKFLPKFDFKFWKIILKNSWPFWLTGLFMTIYFRIDTVMLSLMKTYDVVGWYNAALKLIEGLHFIPTLFIIVVFPAMSRFYIENRRYLQLLYEKTFKYLVILGLPIGVGTTLLADRLIFFIYKNEFINATIALQILIWAEIFVFLNFIIGYLLNSINKQRLFTLTTGICAFVNIALNLLLISKYSYIGAAIATVITQVCVFIMLLYFTMKNKYKINLLKIIAKPVIAGLTMGLIIYYIRFLHILIIIPIAIISYFLILLISKDIGREEFDLVKGILMW